MRQLLGIMSMVYSFGVIAQSEAPKLVSDQLTLVDLRAKFEGFQYVESENVNISIVKRFESGDTFLIDSIEQILNSENKELRHKLYNNFQFDVSDNFNFSPRLQSAILKNLIIDEDIEEVIWISGRFNFKDFKESFEKNIKSLPIESQITMLYWLGVDGTSKIGIDLIEEILLSDKLKQFWSRGLSDALCNYLAHGDSVNREAAIGVALKLYNSKSVYNHLFAKFDEYAAKDFEKKLLNYLFDYGGVKIITIAESIHKIDPRNMNAFAALIRNNPKKYKAEIMSNILNSEYREYGINEGIVYFKSSNDNSILLPIIESCKPDDISNLLFTFETNDLLDELYSASFNMSNKSLSLIIQRKIAIRRKSEKDIAFELLNIGVIKKNEVDDFESKIVEFRNSTSIENLQYVLLNILDINTITPYQSNEFPIEYHQILFEAYKLAYNTANMPVVYMIAHVNRDHSEAKHEVFIDFGKEGILTKHVSTSLYSDDNFILQTLNFFPNNTNSIYKYFIDYFGTTKSIFYTSEQIHSKIIDYLQNEVY